MVGNPSDAEDIVQETVVKAFIHFDSFRAESKFKTWLMSIAVNEVRSKRRKEFRSRLSFFETDQLDALAAGLGSESPLRQYEEKESAQAVRKAILTLHPAYKEMIHLRAMEGMNIADAAQHLSISVAAAKARHHRAMQRLSRTLRRQTKRPLQRAA